MKQCVALAILLLLAVTSQGQHQNLRPDLQFGAVRHSGDKTANVSANHAEAMQEVIRAVREEYGWIVSFEKPPFYSSYDLVDNTDPGWRLAHPNERGVTKTAGGRFSSAYPEPTEFAGSASEQAVLQKIVDDYNASGNPGQFNLVELTSGVYDVIGNAVTDENGKLKQINPVLDTPITIAQQQRTIFETVDVILKQLSAKTGYKFQMSEIPNNLFLNNSVTIGGSNIPARVLLLQTFFASGRPLNWNLHWDPDTGTYFLGSYVAVKRVPNRFGQQVPLQIDAKGHP